MSSQFPAIIIGGPPHRGKSVLSSIVLDVLRQRQILHYRYQATPDGDGKWFNDMQDRIRADSFRNKHPWDHYFEKAVEAILKQRPVPFLVDVGGKPTKRQEERFALATHAIILGGNDSELETWRDMVERQGLIVIAEVHSRREGNDAILAEGLPLILQLTGLERGRGTDSATSPAWQALIEAIVTVLEPSSRTAWEYHWRQMDSDILPFHAEQWLIHHTGRTQWEAADLIALHAALSPDTPLALFADYPTWVVPSIATYLDAELRCFDARFGWLSLPTLIPAHHPENSPWVATVAAAKGFTALRLRLHRPHLVPHSVFRGTLPVLPFDSPMVIDGQLPRWLYAAFARHYAAQGHQVGIALPRINQAVIINGQAMGSLIPWVPIDD